MRRDQWRVQVYFYPRPPRGGRPVRSDHQPPAGQFLSTPSARRATTEATAIALAALFLSTPSARRATDIQACKSSRHDNFYPRPPRGGRRKRRNARRYQTLFLSTPSARRATNRSCARRGAPHISIHALREEGDQWKATSPRSNQVFLSTPSARRATKTARKTKAINLDFYPRPPRGGRPIISSFQTVSFDFYPRPPRGGRPRLSGVPLRTLEISIHALREEGDVAFRPSSCALSKFLSTPSARRATISVCQHLSHRRFLSTPSARRATKVRRKQRHFRRISIHALREEGDIDIIKSWRDEKYFYPRPPRGGRLSETMDDAGGEAISIHALREEGDVAAGCLRVFARVISIHALREEGDSKNRDKISIFKQIIQHSARI